MLEPESHSHPEPNLDMGIGIQPLGHTTGEMPEPDESKGPTLYLFELAPARPKAPLREVRSALVAYG